MAEPEANLPKNLRKNAKLKTDKLYFRAEAEYPIGSHLNFAPYLKNARTLKSGLSRNEKRDEYDKAYRERNNYTPTEWKRLPDNDYTYEVEIIVVRKFNSKTLQEITPDRPQDPILIATPSNEESWDSSA